jgi:hypothetical protein
MLNWRASNVSLSGLVFQWLTCKLSLSVVLVAALVGCGGGSSLPPPVNLSPSFNSLAQINVDENRVGAFYTAIATDPEGRALTYSIKASNDSDRFVFDPASRSLSFVAAPDFELPSDANRDNIYEVLLSVTDGVNATDLALNITVTNVIDGLLPKVRRVASGFTEPIAVTGLPDGSGRILVVERGGRVIIMDPKTGVIDPTPFLDIRSEITNIGEFGLYSIAFNSDFSQSRHAYVLFTEKSNVSIVRRYNVTSGATITADPASQINILEVKQPAGLTNHKGGMLVFGPTNGQPATANVPNGQLLIGLGDGGGGGDPLGNGQNPNSLLGKILRLDVSGDDFPSDPTRNYRIPASNPFARGGGAPEIFATGLRNPFRGTFDSVSNAIFIADVGQGAVEEVNRMAADFAGPIVTNFGWNLREGTQPYLGGIDSPAFTKPVTEYTHGNGPTQGRSITGGIVYRGPVPSLKGRYFFGDFITSNIWSLPIESLVVGSTVQEAQFKLHKVEFMPNVGTINLIVDFGTDTAGNMYIVDIDGEIFAVEQTD